MSINRATFRKRSNYLLARVSEAARAVVRPVFSPTRKQTAPGEWRRGLLIGADHIGDVLYNTASLPHLARGLPDCKWSYLADPPAAELLRTNPFIDELIVRAPGLLDEIRRRKFDVAICYNSGQYWRDLIFAWRAGIPNRVGYVHKGFSGLITFPITIDYPQPYAVYFRSLVSQLTGGNAAWELRPKVYATEDDCAAAEQLWRELKLQDRARVLACFVTSRQPTGIWPLEYFAETLSTLADKYNVTPVLCGSAGDRSVLSELLHQCRRDWRIVAGSLSLNAVSVFLSKCSVVLCPDTGPRHLANAGKVPVFFFRNLRSSKVESGAYCSSEIDLAPDVEFIAPAAQARYLRSIPPSEVVKRLASLFAPGRCASTEHHHA